MPATTRADCPFCAIVDGHARAHLVLQDAHTAAFLDARPLFPGHVLIVPSCHCETLADVPRGDIGPLFENVQWLCNGIEQGLGAHGTLVVVNNRISQSVPHVHVHVVPRRKGDGLRGFMWPRRPYSTDDEAAGIAEKIRDAVARAKDQ